MACFGSALWTFIITCLDVDKRMCHIFECVLENAFRRKLTERDTYLASRGKAEGPHDPVRRHGVKRLSVLFSLPYWKVCALTCS